MAESAASDEQVSPGPLALRLLASYHPILTLGAYLSRICGRPEADILAVDHEGARFLLETAIVGYTAPLQQVPDGLGGKGKEREVVLDMAQVVTLAQGSIFARGFKANSSLNQLVLGYRKTRDYEDGAFDHRLAPYSTFADNTNVQQIIESDGFAAILRHVGAEALVQLLSSASLYLPCPPLEHACYIQVAGEPVGSIQAPRLLPSTKRKREATREDLPVKSSNGRRKAKAMVLPRVLIHHRWAERDGNNKIVVGLPSSHILCRLATLEPRPSSTYHVAIHLAKHVFPAQFGLANIFTTPLASASAGRGTPVIPDWQDREAEIRKRGPVKTTQRLKDACKEDGLLWKVAERAGKVDAKKLLNRHCASKLDRRKGATEQGTAPTSPVPPSHPEADRLALPVTQDARAEHSLDVSHPSMIVPHGATDAVEAERKKPHAFDHAVRPHSVEEFVWAMISAWGLAGWWGSDANQTVVRKQLRRMINLRRYESVTLHDLMQGFRMAECDWLVGGGAGQTDDLKRRELLQEFSWWFYASFVGGILRTTFYITESTAFRNRLLFFRQDDWNALCLPVLQNIKEVHFEKIPRDEVGRGQLGYSYMRLMPKESGVRPVVNLRRKITKRQGNTQPKSINSMLQEVFAAMNFEKGRKPDLMGASVLGPNEVYLKLKRFKASLGTRRQKLYFVKVDIRACFDTIEQGKLLDVIESVLKEPIYTMQRYSCVTSTVGRISRSFGKRATAPGWEQDGDAFADLAGRLAQSLRNAILCDLVTYPVRQREELVQLLKEHVTQHRIKIGRSVYRQKVGIAQGSVVSALLCSMFYADMEQTRLDFTKDPSSMLVRLIDDFLFVTPSPELAVRFLKSMSAGHPDYGCHVSVEKSLVNFPVEMELPATAKGGTYVSGEKVMVSRVLSTDFPWCGYVIDTTTLDVRADYGRAEKLHIADGLTIDYARPTGQAFRQKVLQAAKQRTHIVYTDTTLNSAQTVHLNIYQGTMMAAMKFVALLKESGNGLENRATFLHDVIQQYLQYLHITVQNRTTTAAASSGGGRCDVPRKHIIWLGKHAFHRVLSRRPTRFRDLISMLSASLDDHTSDGLRRKLGAVVRAPSNASLDKMRF